MTDSQRVLAPLRFSTVVAFIDGGWTATVYAVTPSKRLRVFETVQPDEAAARISAYNFVRCQR